MPQPCPGKLRPIALTGGSGEAGRKVRRSNNTSTNSQLGAWNTRCCGSDREDRVGVTWPLRLRVVRMVTSSCPSIWRTLACGRFVRSTCLELGLPATSCGVRGSMGTLRHQVLATMRRWLDCGQHVKRRVARLECYAGHVRARAGPHPHQAGHHGTRRGGGGCRMT